MIVNTLQEKASSSVAAGSAVPMTWRLMRSATSRTENSECVDFLVPDANEKTGGMSRKFKSTVKSIFKVLFWILKPNLCSENNILSTMIDKTEVNQWNDENQWFLRKKYHVWECPGNRKKLRHALFLWKWRAKEQ